MLLSLHEGEMRWVSELERCQKRRRDRDRQRGRGREEASERDRLTDRYIQREGERE